MKKTFLTIPLLILALVFVVSCSDDSKESDSTDTTDNTEPTDTTTDTDPTDSTNPTNPTEPTNPTDPTDPTNPTEPTEPTDPTNPTDPTDPTNPTDPTEPTNPTDPTEPTNPTDPEDIGGEIPVDTNFRRFTADNDPNKPAFVTVDDLDEDGLPDMIVAQYGPVSKFSGNYDIYWGTGKLDQWTKETLNIGGNNGISFPHPVKVADINGDGIKDIVSPSGFLACLVNCGNIFWLEGTGTRNQWTKHEIVKNNDHFFFDVSLVDIDGDGVDDILTNASQKKTVSLGNGQDERLMWFKGSNETADRFEKTARVISSGNGGPFPRFVDLNGDGKKDIALAQYFNSNITTNGSFIWFEQTDNIENWTKHIIDNESGESFMLEIIDDLYGDGVRRAVGVNHVNTTDTPNGPKEGVFIFDIPADPTQPWTKKNIATDIKSRNPLTGNQAAPGLFGYGDITGNGLIDLVVSGDGDSRVFWFEQNPAGTFTQHTLDGEAGATVNAADSFGQAGGMQIVDLDGDGKNEIIVTLYEGNKIYIYKYNK